MMRVPTVYQFVALVTPRVLLLLPFLAVTLGREVGLDSTLVTDVVDKSLDAFSITGLNSSFIFFIAM